MGDELRAFRSDLVPVPPRAEARVRARLEERIVAEANGGRDKRRRASGRAAAAAAAGTLAAVALFAAAALVASGPPTAGGRASSLQGVLQPALGEPGEIRALGLLARLPPPEGKDAAMRPTSGQGGWSECGIAECYW